MKLADILHPWAAIAQARREAERLHTQVTAFREVTQALHREMAIVEQERDAALAELATFKRRRSIAISRGNRTRALRRRGGLLPAPINDTAGAAAPHLRTALTG